MQLNFNKKNIVAITKNLFSNIVSRVIICVLVFSFCISYLPISPKFSIGIAHAATEINYQGKLMTSSNVAVPDGLYNMEFKLYTVSSGGSAIWTETRTGASKVQVTSGLFTVLLGSETSLSGVNFDQTIYLGVNIGGTGTPSWDGEMSPRKKFASAPSAFVSDTAKSLDATYATSTNLYASSTLTNALTINSYSGLLIGTNGLVSAIATSSLGLLTTNVAEGSNLYFTDQRADARVNAVLSATTSLPNITTLAGLTTAGNLATVGTLTSGSIGSGFGNINIGSNTFTGNGSGLAALNASNISTGVLAIARGGTGTTTAPTFGQLLMGNASGGYDLVATSTLGILSSQWSTSGSNISYIAGAVGIGTASPRNTNLDIVAPAVTLVTGTGTITSTQNLDDAVVNGTGTLFTSEVKVGDLISNTSGTLASMVTRVVSDTQLYVVGLGVGFMGAGSNYRIVKRIASTEDSNGNTSWAEASPTAYNEQSGAMDYNGRFFGGGYTYFANRNASNQGLMIKQSAVDGRMKLQHVQSAAAITFQGGNANISIDRATLSNVNWASPVRLGAESGGGNETSLYLSRTGTGANQRIQISTEAYSSNVVQPAIDFAATEFIFRTRNSIWNDYHVGTNTLAMDSSGNWTVNDSGGVLDFRIEGDTDSNLLFTDGSVDMLGIGTSTPGYKLTVAGDISLTGALRANGDAGTLGMVLLSNGTGASPTWVATSSLGIGGSSLSGGTSGYLARWTSGSTLSTGVVLDNGTVAGVNATSSTASFTVQGTGALNPFTVASSTGTSLFTVVANGNVGVGSSTPGSKLTVVGTTTISGPLQVAMPTTGALIIGDITGNARGTGSVDLQIRTSAAQVASGLNSVAVGYKNTADGVQGSAFGTENNAAGNYALSAGYYNTANGTKSVAVGNENNVGTNLFSIGIGNNNVVSNTYSSGIGYSNNVSGYYAMAVGMGLTNSISNSFMFGPSQSAAATLLSTGEFRAPFFTGTSTTASTFGGNVGIGVPSPSYKLDVDGHMNISGPHAYKIGGLTALTASTSNQSFAAGIYAGAAFTSLSYYNVAVGQGALTNTTGSAQRNTGVGVDTLGANTTGSANTSLGIASLRSNTTGTGNVAIGDSALYTSTSTAYSTAVGYYALLYATGANNVALGYSAGDNITSGSGNVILGNNIDAPIATGSNQLNIGNLIFGTAIDGVNSTLSSGNIGIGTSTPNQKLVVAGTIQATNLLGGSANLTVDANGNIIRDPSDQGLKENIVTLEGSLAKIEQLRGVRYEWKDKVRFGTSTEIGVIAQEVELVVPEVVSSGGVYKSVNIKNLVALLIEGVKELKVQVDVVKEKVIAISAWFGSDGDRLNVKGLICVDDVCVTKDQFKQILINSGSVMTLPASVGSISGDVSSDGASGTGTSPSETPSGETVSGAPVDGGTEETGGSSAADTASSDEVTPSGSTDPTPTTEPTTPPVVSTPPTESVAPEPAPAPSPAPAPEPAPAPAPTE